MGVRALTRGDLRSISLAAPAVRSGRKKVPEVRWTVAPSPWADPPQSPSLGPLGSHPGSELFATIRNPRPRSEPPSSTSPTPIASSTSRIAPTSWGERDPPCPGTSSERRESLHGGPLRGFEWTARGGHLAAGMPLSLSPDSHGSSEAKNSGVNRPAAGKRIDRPFRNRGSAKRVRLFLKREGSVAWACGPDLRGSRTDRPQGPRGSGLRGASICVGRGRDPALGAMGFENG